MNYLLKNQWRIYERMKLISRTGAINLECLAAESNAPRCKPDVVPVCLQNRCVLRSQSTGEIWAD